jgi:hypothetical protein
MIRYVDYDPKRHKGKTLYEMRDRRDGDMIATYLAEVTDPEQIKAAEQTPWYYLVQEEVPDEAPSAD